MRKPSPGPEKPMKINAEDLDEVQDVAKHLDGGNVHVTMIAELPALISQGFVDALRDRVMKERVDPATHRPNENGNIRSQHFEEGPTYMAVEPVIKDGKPSFPSSVYLMNFYDVDKQPVCSRMHKHTGLRLIFISTGPDSKVNISSLSPIITHDTQLRTTTDDMPGLPEGTERKRHTFVVPPNSYVAVQIPVGTSHQFNTFGPNAVLTSVHPEEKIEVGRESMRGLNMMKQTIWLQKAPPPVEQCNVQDANAFMKNAGTALMPQLLQNFMTIFKGEDLTSYDMARLITGVTRRHIGNREVFGVYHELSKTPDALINVLTQQGIEKKPVSDVLKQVNTIGSATTYVMDPGAAIEVYGRLSTKRTKF